MKIARQSLAGNLGESGMGLLKSVNAADSQAEAVNYAEMVNRSEGNGTALGKANYHSIQD